MGVPRRDKLPQVASGLLGKKLESVERMESATILRLQGEWLICIYNPIRVFGDANRHQQDLLADLVGSNLTDLETNHSSVTLSFDAAIHIIVDLSDTAYNGPEAMQVSGPNNVIVVWN